MAKRREKKKEYDYVLEPVEIPQRVVTEYGSMFVNLFDMFIASQFRDGHIRFPYNAFMTTRIGGKTYSMLSNLTLQTEERGSKFIYMRRTRQQLSMALRTNKEEKANPFKSINRDLGTHYYIQKASGADEALMGIIKSEDNDLIYGYALDLYDIASIRGIDLSDVDYFFYDEFVKEKHVKRMKGEADALFNAFSTVKRDREERGLPPMIVVMAANSSDFANPIFAGLGIVRNIEREMQRIGSDSFDLMIPEKALRIVNAEPSQELKEAMKEDSLSMLTEGTSFHEEVFQNKYSSNDFSAIRSVDLRNYRPICAYDGMYVYERKGQGLIAMCYREANVPFFTNTVQGRKKFCALIGNYVYQKFIDGQVVFESYDLKQKFLSMYVKDVDF